VTGGRSGRRRPRRSSPARGRRPRPAAWSAPQPPAQHHRDDRRPVRSATASPAPGTPSARGRSGRAGYRRPACRSGPRRCVRQGTLPGRSGAAARDGCGIGRMVRHNRAMIQDSGIRSQESGVRSRPFRKPGSDLPTSVIVSAPPRRCVDEPEADAAPRGVGAAPRPARGGRSPRAGKITTPKEFLGFDAGDDYTLATTRS